MVDANLLLYAYHPRDQRHERARSWLERALIGREPVGFAWSTILAFLRISTNPRVFESPLSGAEAGGIVSSWMSEPAFAPVAPGERYWDILRALLVEAQVTGPLVSDAALAALAIEHGAALATTDRDFARFSGLRVVNPLER